MTINRATIAGRDAGAIDAFIGRVPNGGREGVICGRREQITLTIPPGQLARIGDTASGMGQSRAARMNRAIDEPAGPVAP